MIPFVNGLIFPERTVLAASSPRHLIQPSRSAVSVQKRDIGSSLMTVGVEFVQNRRVIHRRIPRVAAVRGKPFEKPFSDPFLLIFFLYVKRDNVRQVVDRRDNSGKLSVIRKSAVNDGVVKDFRRRKAGFEVFYAFFRIIPGDEFVEGLPYQVKRRGVFAFFEYISSSICLRSP